MKTGHPEGRPHVNWNDDEVRSWARQNCPAPIARVELLGSVHPSIPDVAVVDQTRIDVPVIRTKRGDK